MRASPEARLRCCRPIDHSATPAGNGTAALSWTPSVLTSANSINPSSTDRARIAPQCFDHSPTIGEVRYELPTCAVVGTRPARGVTNSRSSGSNATCTNPLLVNLTAMRPLSRPSPKSAPKVRSPPQHTGDPSSLSSTGMTMSHADLCESSRRWAGLAVVILAPTDDRRLRVDSTGVVLTDADIDQFGAGQVLSQPAPLAPTS